MERSKVLIPVLTLLLASCGPSGFHEPMASLTTEPAVTHVPPRMITTPIKMPSSAEGADRPQKEVKLIDGATRDRGLKMVTDGANNTATLTGFLNLQPKEGGAPVEIPLEFKGTMTISEVTGFNIAHMRPVNHKVLEGLKVEAAAKMMCLTEDCSQYFVNIYVRYNNNKEFYYRHQIESVMKEPDFAEKPSDKAEEQKPSKKKRRSGPDFSAVDENGDYSESDAANDNGKGGFYVGEVEQDLEKFDDISKPEPSGKEKPLLSNKDEKPAGSRNEKPEAKSEKEKPVAQTPPAAPAQPEPPKSEPPKADKPAATAPAPAPAPVKPAQAPAPAPQAPAPQPQPQPQVSAPEKPAATSGKTEIKPPDLSIAKRMAQAFGSVNAGWLERATDIFSFTKKNDAAGFRIVNPKRLSYFGTRDMEYMLALAGEYSKKNVNNYILSIGDIAYQAGGKIGRHKSHRNGMDADISYYFDREKLKTRFVDVLSSEDSRDAWMVNEQWGLFKKLVETNRVDMIIVYPVFKDIFCDLAKKNGEYRTGQYSGVAYETLRRFWPDEDHADHFHLRLLCSESQPNCKPRRENYEIPRETGCK